MRSNRYAKLLKSDLSKVRLVEKATMALRDAGINPRGFKPTPAAGVFSLSDLVELENAQQRAYESQIAREDKVVELDPTPRTTIKTATKLQVINALHKTKGRL